VDGIDDVTRARNAIFADVIDDKTARAALNISEPTLDRYIKDGLPHFKIGRRRLYELAALRVWVLSHQKCAPARPQGRPRKTSA
jgi:hypothetical protein